MPIESQPAVSAGTQPTFDTEYGYFALQDQAYSVDARSAELLSITDRRVVDVGTGPSLASTALDSIVDSIRSESVDVDAFGPLMQALAKNPGLVKALATLDSFDELIQTVTLSKRRRALALLRAAAADPQSTAETMWTHVTREWWVFGSQLAPLPRAWDVADLPQRCLPLIRFDRAVHLVLVEGPNVELVEQSVDGVHHVAPSVYAEFDRARHLVGLLQDNRKDIADRLVFNSGRTSVSVLIGYPSSRGLPRHVVREQIRQLNSFIKGFNVVTYDELINLADDMLLPPEEGAESRR
ncbi:MAG: hypothetical protein ACM3JP_01080 [Betaproteobacteria bacterium]